MGSEGQGLGFRAIWKGLSDREFRSWTFEVNAGKVRDVSGSVLQEPLQAAGTTTTRLPVAAVQGLRDLHLTTLKP